ncbi:NUDIX hydrolase [Arthrobacter sp. ISL-48]|uniref:NUDIX domain-containing protein n=1 Tax=Arthrobacter sp. ISL-48 TaxID=2819110 RepID=UPI001BE81791|nr:NUDIX domain-containing protein [Arthrobacter sp. ISL-48]MBT2533016.1 NUDIX hydrolase [Arthrobacter sp. ISL-48]
MADQHAKGAMTAFSIPATSSLPAVGKVAIYILNGDLDKYITFTQPDFPEAGRQVPAGTIEDGETPPQAASRELQEETGLNRRISLFHFADSVYDMSRYKPEIQIRSWFLGVAEADDFPTGRWTQIERRADQPDIVAEFSWTEISFQEQLIAGHSDLLPVALHLAHSWSLNS